MTEFLFPKMHNPKTARSAYIRIDNDYGFHHQYE
tara:strand:- start:26645 stop:26746 length:102 start_codon:yes stop_codon:yes gene_type:complete